MSNETAKPRAKVRKIFKKGDTFLCGLCGKVYESIPEAEACLRADSKTMLSEAGTQEAPAKRYRCSLCKRVYGSIEEAKACSLACKKSVEERMQKEEQATRASSIEEKLKMLEKFAKDPSAIEALKVTQAQVQAAPKVIGTFKQKTNAILPGENIKFQREKNMFRCLKCRQKYSAADDARQCYDAHGEGPIKVGKATSGDTRYTLDKDKFRCTKCERLYHIAADAINCWEGHTVQVSEKKVEEASPAYYRDGARYICRKCNRKYFTREDVIACYEGPHDDVPIVETPPATEIKSIPDPVPSINKKDDGEKFFRDGARYVCKACSKRYFSRDEVLACFDADSKGEASSS